MKHRLFVAIEIPRDLGSQIATLQKKLDQLKIPVDWEPLENIHLTVNFIGRTEDDKINSVKQQIREATREFPPFELVPVFLQTLYKRHEPSLIYLAVGVGQEALNQLHGDIAIGLEHIHIPQPQRFLPHITIGRLKRTDPQTSKDALDKVRDFEYQPLDIFTVDHVSIFESFLSKAGSHYQRLLDFPLREDLA